jgi:hypothetical protein
LHIKIVGQHQVAAMAQDGESVEKVALLVSLADDHGAAAHDA